MYDCRGHGDAISIAHILKSREKETMKTRSALTHMDIHLPRHAFALVYLYNKDREKGGEGAVEI